MNETLTDTLFDEISTRDKIISDLTNEKDIALEQFNAAVDALNEAYREIDRLNQPDEAEATEEMVNEMLDICDTEEESWVYDDTLTCDCGDCEEENLEFATQASASQVKVDFNETLDSVIAGTLVAYDKKSNSLLPGDLLMPGELLQLAELKRQFSPSKK